MSNLLAFGFWFCIVHPIEPQSSQILLTATTAENSPQQIHLIALALWQTGAALLILAIQELNMPSPYRDKAHSLLIESTLPRAFRPLPQKTGLPSRPKNVEHCDRWLDQLAISKSFCYTTEQIQGLVIMYGFIKFSEP